MTDERKIIPYKVEKGNRPKIEDVISYCLDGDLQKSALNFTTFMNENKMPFKVCTSTTRVQRANYKGEQICHIRVYGENDWEHVDQHHPGDPSYWTVSPNLLHIAKYNSTIITEGLQNILWDNLFYCKNYDGNIVIGCNPNKRCAGGRTLTMLGKEFKHICWCRSNAIIRNPDETMFNGIKRLIELEQQARIDSKK